jgi:hypothetical protein
MRMTAIIWLFFIMIACNAMINTLKSSISRANKLFKTMVSRKDNIKDYLEYQLLYETNDTIHMRDEKLNNDDAYIIANFLRTNTKVTSLNLSYNSIGYKGIFSILESIIMNPNSSVKRLQINSQNPDTMYFDETDINSDLFTISYSPENKLTIKLKNNVVIENNLKLRDLELRKNHMMSDVYNKIFSEYLKHFKGLHWVHLQNSTLTNDFIEDIISITMSTKNNRLVNMSSNLHPDKVYDIWMNNLYKFFDSNPDTESIYGRYLIYHTSTETHVMSFDADKYTNYIETIKYKIKPIQGHGEDVKMSMTKDKFMDMMLQKKHEKLEYIKLMLNKKLRYMKYYSTGINESSNQNDKYKL